MSAAASREEPRGGPAYDEPDLLRDQFRQLLRYRLLIVCGILLGLAGGGWLGLNADARYTASAEVTVRTPTADPFAGEPADRVAMGSERRTADSDVVAARAAELLGEQPAEGPRLRRELQVTNPPNTEVLRFAYTADDPGVAAERANAFVQAYLDNRQADADATIAHTVAALDDQRAPLQERRAELEDQLATLPEGSPGYDSALADLSTVTGQISELTGEISSLRALDTAGGRVITEATPPTSPSGPGLALLLGLGYVVGIALGLLAAWVRLVFDPTVRSPGDVTRALHAPVLGVLPRAGRGGAPGDEQLLAEGRLAEEYRSVAFRLAYDETFAHRRRLLVVAPRGAIDAPLAASVNLTAAFAEMGMNALLVEADLRTPSLIGQLRHADGVRPGWARQPARLDGGWPAGLRVPIDAGESGIFDLVPGRRVRNVPRALTAPQATELIGHADARGAVVVVLAPAVLNYADAIALSDRVDGVLVVCDPSQVRREDLHRVRELVVGAGGTLLGAVLHSWGHGPAVEERGAEGAADAPGADGAGGAAGAGGTGAVGGAGGDGRGGGRSAAGAVVPAGPGRGAWPARAGGRGRRALPPGEGRDGNAETLGLRILDDADAQDQPPGPPDRRPPDRPPYA